MWLEMGDVFFFTADNTVIIAMVRLMISILSEQLRSYYPLIRGMMYNQGNKEIIGSLSVHSIDEAANHSGGKGHTLYEYEELL